MATDFQRIIRVLVSHDVDFVIVGALSAVLHGAPVSTFDIDIVHDRDDDNLDRLLDALDDLNARYRRPDDKVIRPDRQGMSGDGHHLLETDDGPLDVLGTIETNYDYTDLLDFAVELEFDESPVQVLSLEKYLDFVEQSDRPGDQAKLAVLRETLDRSEDGT